VKEGLEQRQRSQMMKMLSDIRSLMVQTLMVFKALDDLDISTDTKSTSSSSTSSEDSENSEEQDALTFELIQKLVTQRYL